MEIWNYFIYFALAVAALTISSAAMVFYDKMKTLVLILQSLALGTMLSYIIIIWVTFAYPPMRTMGETRLWYSLFIILAGILTLLRYKYKWILIFTAILSTVFNLINILKPEIHTQSLMPVLQSVWFIPHVSIYMFSYAIFAFAFLLAIVGMFYRKRDFSASILELTLVGVALFGFGMFIGAMWAKQAWGNYWTWDIKETWAAATWALYLLYVHLCLQPQSKTCLLNFVMILAFSALQMCWWGINFLPNVQSVHVYN